MSLANLHAVKSNEHDCLMDSLTRSLTRLVIHMTWEHVAKRSGAQLPLLVMQRSVRQTFHSMLFLSTKQSWIPG